MHILLSRTNHDLRKTIEISKKLIEKDVNINVFDNKNRLALQYLINMKYTDEDLKPLYDLWFSQPYIEMLAKNNTGVSPIDLAKKIPYRNVLLEMMQK